MRWLSLVQSTHSQVDELSWAKVDVQRLRASTKFGEMIRQEGIPHSLRPFLWPRLCGAVEKRKRSRHSPNGIILAEKHSQKQVHSAMPKLCERASGKVRRR